MAYSSLISLAQILDQIFCQTPKHLIYNEKQFESLREEVGFLQEFIEDCDWRRIKITQTLENQMRNLAHLAEDIIETKMLDDTLETSPPPSEGYSIFCQKIEEVIEEFVSIKKMVVSMKEREAVGGDQRPSRLPPGGRISRMVGFRQHLIRVMDELTGQQPKRQILAIAGMGGIGKTTLCRNVFENPLIVQHFHIRAWVTVSQEYNVGEIILRLLQEIRQPFEDKYQETINEQRDDQLGEQLYKGLSGRKYLIVMDDIWSIQVWEEMKMFLPDNENGSRIMMTTRLSDVARRLSSCRPYKMDFLDENESWSLLCQTVFGQESYPVEFEDIGRQIARECRGLPLAIVVVGGLLAKSDMTEEYWEYVAQHLSSIVNSGNDEHCLNILHLSYEHLPVHLKPCFLYMGIFPKDREISVSKLIKLWVAEGFLKPVVAKSMEEVAEEYLRDLIDRNLVMFGTRKFNTKSRSCCIHDLLRDLCSKVAHKENFFCQITGTYQGIDSLGGDHPSSTPHLIHSSTTAYGRKIPSSKNDMRRLVISVNRFSSGSKVYRIAQSAQFTRSLFSNCFDLAGDLFLYFRFLRIVDSFNDYSPETIPRLINSRYLAFRIHPSRSISSIPASIKSLQNLQTLVIKSMSSYDSAGIIALPSEIWEMPQLRHIEINQAILPDPPPGRALNMDTKSNYLHNLQTLSTVRNFSCDNKNVLERIPNVKKLKIYWDGQPQYNLNNLLHLRKLESLSCQGFGKILLGNQAFPDSIKKLTLNWLKLTWKDMNIIGSLPNLEVLKLRRSVYGEEWNTAEGGFLKLRVLLLAHLNLCRWETESSHFPRLESLIILYCQKLEEIPFGIGEIPTLKLIELYNCGEEVISSAEQIQEEQRSLGNEDLQVLVASNSFFHNIFNELSKIIMSCGANFS